MTSQVLTMKVKSASSVLSVQKGHLKENDKDNFITELKAMFKEKTDKIWYSMKVKKQTLNLKDSHKENENTGNFNLVCFH